MEEIFTAVEQAFGLQSVLERPAGAPGGDFRVSRFEVQDSRTLQWSPLRDSRQLLNGCVLYAFQLKPHWAGHGARAAAASPPPPTAPAGAARVGCSPHRARIADCDATGGTPPPPGWRGLISTRCDPDDVVWDPPADGGWVGGAGEAAVCVPSPTARERARRHFYYGAHADVGGLTIPRGMRMGSLAASPPIAAGSGAGRPDGPPLPHGADDGGPDDGRWWLPFMHGVHGWSAERRLLDAGPPPPPSLFGRHATRRVPHSRSGELRRYDGTAALRCYDGSPYRGPGFGRRPDPGYRW